MIIKNLLQEAENKALEKIGDNHFYANQAKMFFIEFENNVLEKFTEAREIEDIYNLTLPDYSAIYLMLKKYGSILVNNMDSNEEFCIRYIEPLESLRETFKNEH